MKVVLFFVIFGLLTSANAAQKACNSLFDSAMSSMQVKSYTGRTLHIDTYGSYFGERPLFVKNLRVERRLPLSSSKVWMELGTKNNSVNLYFNSNEWQMAINADRSMHFIFNNQDQKQSYYFDFELKRKGVDFELILRKADLSSLPFSNSDRNAVQSLINSGRVRLLVRNFAVWDHRRSHPHFIYANNKELLAFGKRNNLEVLKEQLEQFINN